MLHISVGRVTQQRQIFYNFLRTFQEPKDVSYVYKETQLVHGGYRNTC